MKQLNIFPILLLGLILTNLFPVIKSQSLEVTYTETRKIKEKFPESPDPQVQEAVKNAGTQVKEFRYSAGTSIYRMKPKEMEDSPEHIVIKIGDDESGSVYKNLQKIQLIKQNEFFGRYFIIKEPLRPISWKMENEQKNIGNYSCRKATAQIDTMEVTAWYCPEIPVNDGPDIFWGLPGLILEVDVQHGNKTIIANIVKTSNEALSIDIPNQGKEVTQQEFEKIKKDKLDEMRRNHPGGEGDNVEIRVFR